MDCGRLGGGLFVTLILLRAHGSRAGCIPKMPVCLLRVSKKASFTTDAVVEARIKAKGYLNHTKFQVGVSESQALPAWACI